MNLEWLKKHPYAAAGGGLALLVIFVLIIHRSSSSSSNSLGSTITAQNQGQLQMAQLNAQLSSQSEQTQAQLAAQEYATQAQQQEQQTALVGSLASTVIPMQINSQLYQQELAAQEAHQAEIMPLEEQALTISTMGNRAQTGQNLLALLEGMPSTSLPVQGAGTTSPSSFGFAIPGLGQLGANLGTGLFG